MEIDSICLYSNMEETQDESVQQSLSPCSSEMGDSFGDPEVLPRVGDQYQPEIPPLISDQDRLQLINLPRNIDLMANIDEFYLLGLPIPITWSNTGVENISGIVELENSEKSQNTSNNEHPDLKVEPRDTLSGNGKDIGVDSSTKLEVGSDKMEVDFVLPQESESKMGLLETGLCPLPDSLDESWTDIERDSFLLGLYIFGKNLVTVKKFVESKKMEDILSFYYGKFYRSDEYRRWSECRKQRSRRSIHGQKIFTGWRQQELLSRLCCHVSQECQSQLLEVSRSFAEGRISFEEYVFTLKRIVGISTLIQVVAIGKGKDDLTGTAVEPIKPNQTISVRPEIPVGKAWSSLTSSGIIKFLTGDFRLSKARSGDLFWEAVWPRLLARGWHSEKPKDNGICGSKNSLVFLIPGIKKFSRRRLVKGNHYFDSVTDVLSKVASEPGLLELDIEATQSSQHKEEGALDPPGNQDQDGLSKKQHYCYLQPRNSQYNQNVTKFTVVDTSLAHGAERTKVRELRSLPVENASLSSFSSLSSETDEDTSEDSQENVVETNTSNPQENVINRRACVDSLACVNSPPNIDIHNTPGPSVLAEESHENQSVTVNIDKEVRKTMKYQFSRKAESGCSKYLVPITKQQGNVACNPGDSSCHTKSMSADRKLTRDESHYYMSNLPDVCEEMIVQVDPHSLSSASSLGKDSPAESNEGLVNEHFLFQDASSGKPLSPKLIDLNIPSVSPDLAVDGHGMTAMEQNNEYVCVNNSSFLSGLGHQPEPYKLPDAEVHTGQQPIMNSRRQSTRSRPLTTKALEALEMGFLALTKKRKCADVLEKNSISRPSPRVRRKTSSKATSKAGATDDAAQSKAGESLDGFHDKSDMVGQS
ncbi:uncharacterized protein LOC8272074 [Ricinus communis]|uniref:uncharacterized protein LOC8272074 n=1 Tax=Ricinus communis TaxID=3988 RepID=UPI00201AEF8A|nr:uncharacterized protein LOC8272074 [Ricinus communis]XP_048235538.1 uncharacterized protein LOC8272074 [Ricinus communis]